MKEKKEKKKVAKPKSSLPFWKREGFQGYMFMFPTLIGLPAFCIYPMIYTLYTAFCDWDGTNAPVWAGIKNFKYILTIDPIFWKSLGITLVYALINVPITLILGMALAVLLNKSIKGIRLFRTIYYLPTIVPGIASMVLWQFLYRSDVGLINGILNQIGLPSVGWLTSEKVVLISLSIMKWWGVGGMMIIFLSGLQSVPADLYEAAQLDGARGWSQFKSITFPMITPIVFLQLVTGIIGGMQAFAEAQVMTSGGPNYASYFINYDIYLTAFETNKFGRASAMALVLFAIIMVLTVIVFGTSEQYVYYENE